MNDLPEIDVVLYESFWKFAAERQKIFFAKLAGLPQEDWTDDPVLKEKKFTNVYRASDRVSQYLIRNVIYNDGYSALVGDILFRILLFKLFNSQYTWELLGRKFGWGITVEQFDRRFDDYVQTMDESVANGHGVFHSAYMQTGTKPYKLPTKHANHLAVLRHMFIQDDLTGAILTAESLEDVFKILLGYPLIGPFLAYQFAIDINYSEVTNFDENSFVYPGGGAIRGVIKCFQMPENSRDVKTTVKVIKWMTENQDAEFERLGLEFMDLFGRPMHLIDVQNVFCEVDKKARVDFPELVIHGRTRIRKNYKPTPEPIEYFYPPKWGINEEVGKWQNRKNP